MRFRVSTLAAVLVLLAAWTPVSASGSEKQVRVLFLSSGESGQESREAAEVFERTAQATGSALVVVHELARAEVLIQITSFNRGTNKAGEPNLRWQGQFMLLVQPSQAKLGGLAVAEPFKIVMTGPDEAGTRKAVAALGRILAEALGREQPPAAPGTI